MLYKIARKLTTEYIDNLSFADRTGGLVRVMKDARGKKETQKTYPVENNQDKVLGDKQYMRRLIPDSGKKSVMYWELGSTPTMVDDHNAYNVYEAELKLVCWFNYQEVDPDMYDPAFMIAEIKNAIPFKIGNFDCLTVVTCNCTGEDSNKGEIFSNYTYHEPESQFYKYPYDYFVLNFEVSYRVVRNCFEEGLATLPVDPVLIQFTGNDVKTFDILGVSGREYQTEIYAADLTVITAKTLHEFSGEDQEVSFTPEVGQDSYFKLDYGREYLKKIEAATQNITSITIPDDDNIRLMYVDLEGNAIVTESILVALIQHLYDTNVKDGYLDISGGTNAGIVDATALSQITTLVNVRNWTINYNGGAFYVLTVGSFGGFAYGYDATAPFGAIDPILISGLHLDQIYSLTAVTPNECVLRVSEKTKIDGLNSVDIIFDGHGTVTYTWDLVSGEKYNVIDAALTTFLQTNVGNNININIVT